ncbi:MAG: hypothetical protein FJ291_05615 [Planctomycetes bacterium]|nr:hypothetical protein [Planctomycetota bacterium]
MGLGGSPLGYLGDQLPSSSGTTSRSAQKPPGPTGRELANCAGSLVHLHPLASPTAKEMLSKTKASKALLKEYLVLVYKQDPAKFEELMCIVRILLENDEAHEKTGIWLRDSNAEVEDSDGKTGIRKFFFDPGGSTHKFNTAQIDKAIHAKENHIQNPGTAATELVARWKEEVARMKAEKNKPKWRMGFCDEWVPDHVETLRPAPLGWQYYRIEEGKAQMTWRTSVKVVPLAPKDRQHVFVIVADRKPPINIPKRAHATFRIVFDSWWKGGPEIDELDAFLDRRKLVQPGQNPRLP